MMLPPRVEGSSHRSEGHGRDPHSLGELLSLKCLPEDGFH